MKTTQVLTISTPSGHFPFSTSSEERITLNRFQIPQKPQENNGAAPKIIKMDPCGDTLLTTMPWGHTYLFYLQKKRYVSLFGGRVVTATALLDTNTFRVILATNKKELKVIDSSKSQ